MKKSELKKYEKLLLKKREEIVLQLQDRKTQIDSTIKEATGDISGYSYHMADQGTDMMDREMAFMQSSKTSRFVYHIDAALRRIESGEYGKCENCDKAINPERLEAVPHARLCIKCKSEEEKKEKSGRK